MAKKTKKSKVDKKAATKAAKKKVKESKIEVDRSDIPAKSPYSS